MARLSDRNWIIIGDRDRPLAAIPRRGFKPSRPTIPQGLRDAVYERDGHACVWCGTTEQLSLDHVWPYSLGGDETLDNLQTLCRSCNSSKGARTS